MSTALTGGFANPAHDSANAFRPIMVAMARPGEIQDIAGAVPPAPLSVAAGTVIATLCDPETPVYLAPSVDQQAVRDWITFHTGAPLVGPEKAVFAIGEWAEQPLTKFAFGTAEYPDRSVTVIVESPELVAEGASLRGPGIKDVNHLNLPETEAFARNNALFPLGLDFIFTSGARLAALPRSTKVS